jgi:hypothetical protein
MLTSLIIWNKNEATKNYNIGSFSTKIDIYTGISIWMMLLSKYCNQRLCYIGHFHTLMIVPVFCAFKIYMSVTWMKFVYLNWLVFFFISIVNPTRYSNFSNLFYFWDNSLHVSDGVSVHHQEFKTVRTAAGICTVLYSWWWTGKDHPEHVECYPKNKINLRSCCIFFGFTVEIYCDARSYEHQIWKDFCGYIALIILLPLFVNYSSNSFCFSSLYVSGHKNYCSSERKIDYYYTVYNQNESCYKLHDVPIYSQNRKWCISS